MGRLFSSLTNRIFLASTLLATLALGFAFAFVNARVATEVEAELQRDLAEASTLVDQRRELFTDSFTTMVRLIADLPKLKAAVETRDRPTVQPLADQYQQEIDTDVLVLTGPSGQVLASSGRDAAGLTALQAPANFDEISTVLPHARGLLQVVSIPILIGERVPGFLGRLTVGFFLDDRRAAQFKAVTGSEIAFAANGRVLSSSLPRAAREPLSKMLNVTGVSDVVLGGERFAIVARPLEVGTATPGSVPPGATTLILHSRADRMRYLDTVRTGLAGALVAAVLLATVLSYVVARTVTRPLAAVTSAMREVAATGDLSRRVSVPQRVWDDEDARLLGGAFNTLTESIAAFQRQEAQRDRLSSLGRLSTVIAHEIRNPLMIIRASLGALRSSASAAEVREAVADIDEETRRLNRLVTEVLDFAKPLRFDLAEANLNDVCKSSTLAAWAGAPQPAVELSLDPELPTAVTDAERLRTALINILGNARHAVEASRGAAAAGPAPHVVVRTERAGEHAVITISDGGIGIAPADLPHIFDPYFTTRRAGTGLGLPIAKNIIEGLGGSIVVRSQPRTGTDVRIDLPLRPAGAAA
ncbi:MAG TPA: ATP-binding protein [Vicinamibacterales bacterium]